MYLIVENEYNPQRAPRHPWNDYTWIDRIEWSACYPAPEYPWNATSPLAGPDKDDNIPPSSSPVEFSLFQRLPLEIREMIWGFALAAIGPRNVYLKEKAQRRPLFQGYRVRSDVVTGDDYPDERLFRMVILSPDLYEQVKGDFGKLSKNEKLPQLSHPYPAQHRMQFYNTDPCSPGFSYGGTVSWISAYNGPWIWCDRRPLGDGWVQIEIEDPHTGNVLDPICGWEKTCALPTIIFTCREVFAVASRSRISLHSLGSFGNSYLDADRDILVVDEFSFEQEMLPVCGIERGRALRNKSLLGLCYQERHRIQRLAFEFGFDFRACYELSFILSQFDNIKELILFAYDLNLCYESKYGNGSYRESEIDFEFYDPVSKTETRGFEALRNRVVAKVRAHLESRSKFWNRHVEKQEESYGGGPWPTTLVVPKTIKFMLATRKPKGADTQVMMSKEQYRVKDCLELFGRLPSSSFYDSLTNSATNWNNDRPRYRNCSGWLDY